jgi:hypothetical protein
MRSVYYIMYYSESSYFPKIVDSENFMNEYLQFQQNNLHILNIL